VVKFKVDKKSCRIFKIVVSLQPLKQQQENQLKKDSDV